MIYRQSDDCGLIDLLIARWEVSPLGTIPATLAVISLPILFVATAVTQAAMASGARVPCLISFALWLTLSAVDVCRGIWTIRNPYASARWLQAVRIAVGDTLADQALDHMVICYGQDPEYVITRHDMSIAVQVARQQSAPRSGIRLAQYLRG